MNQEVLIRPRRILTGEELAEAERWVDYATSVAKRSACTRSKRGAVIVNQYGKLIGEGANGPHKGFEHYCDPCMRASLEVPHGTRYELCCGEHAERVAIDNAIRRALGANDGSQYGYSLWKARIYHIALDDEGNPRASGEPSCTLCSGPILKWGLRDVVLWHGDKNYEAYDARTFHELSIKNTIRRSGLSE